MYVSVIRQTQHFRKIFLFHWDIFLQLIVQNKKAKLNHKFLQLINKLYKDTVAQLRISIKKSRPINRSTFMVDYIRKQNV